MLACVFYNYCNVKPNSSFLLQKKPHAPALIPTLLLLLSQRALILTLCFKTFTQFRLGLSVGPQAAFGVELVWHGCCGDHCLQATLALGHVLLWMEEDHIDLGHVEHPQRDRRTKAYWDGQGRGLDVHLDYGRQSGEKTLLGQLWLEHSDVPSFRTPGKAGNTLHEFMPDLLGAFLLLSRSPLG